MQEDSRHQNKHSPEKSQRLFIGLMSGTSVDSIDAVLIAVTDDKLSLIDTLSHPIPATLKKEIFSLFQPGPDEIERMGTLDVKLSHVFAEAVFCICKKAKVNTDKIEAIGSHGQTIRHQPPSTQTTPFTLQIGDPNTLASLTGIKTIADFRRKDIALGGHGAPLAPGFHHYEFRDTKKTRVIVNIGGMANITILNPEQPTLGFDTGPGNALMDSWIKEEKGIDYDKGGSWAAQGTINRELLNEYLSDPYFSQKAPKSTGRERFNNCWLKDKLKQYPNIKPADLQATLCETTAKSISNEIIKNLSPEPNTLSVDVYICGGGAHNTHLMSRLAALLQEPNESIHQYKIATTEELGIHPDWVEAVAFGWLAMRRIDMEAGNLPSVTGASRSGVLGGMYLP